MESHIATRGHEIKWWHVFLVGLIINLAILWLPPAAHWATLITLLVLQWIGSTISLFIALLARLLFQTVTPELEKRQTLQFALGIVSWWIMTGIFFYYF